MSRSRIQYNCTECGGISVKWQGQCPHCQAWNTLAETAAESSAPSRHNAWSATSRIERLEQVEFTEETRIASGIAEFDRVLGGGLVPGGVVLIGGDPGIGKSTLLLQTLAALASNHATLYVSAEESAQQIAMRARRLQLQGGAMQLLAEIRLDAILETLRTQQPAVAVIDSIQTVYWDELQSAPGSVSQVRECAAQLTRHAKLSGTTLFLVGHVTKEGTLAGPRVLEHIVDTVLYFEGDSSSSFRLVRAFKNRFGAVNELGVFAMTDRGLKGVNNPSALFLSGQRTGVPGSCVMVTQEGTRPLLVEIQALVENAASPNPRRLSVGLEQNRLAMLLAVLHRHAGIACQDQDVFINAVGGVRINEPAADLPLLAAIVSSFRNKPAGEKLVLFGEVGLTGEIRPVQRGQERLKEAAKLGFTQALVPQANLPRQPIPGLTVTGVADLRGAIDFLRETS